MLSKNVKEFAEKLKALEKEYGLQVVAYDPFCGRVILDKETNQLYDLNGELED